MDLGAIADSSGTRQLAASDGVVDYAGASGVTLAGPVDTVYDTEGIGGTASGYVGTGTVPLTAAATAKVQITGPANMDVGAESYAATTASLTYDYTPADDSSSYYDNDAESGFFSLVTTGNGNVAVGGFGTPAPITSSTQVVQFADRTTGWSNSATIVPFNPALGQLVSVNLALSTDLQASVAEQNIGSTEAAFATAQTAEASLQLPGTQTVGADAEIDTSNTVAAGSSNVLQGLTAVVSASNALNEIITDGSLISYPLASQATEVETLPPGVTASAASNTTTVDDLAGFIGTQPLVLPISVLSDGTIDGPGNFTAQITASAGATLDVSYTYIPTTAPYVLAAPNTASYVAGQGTLQVDPQLTLGDNSTNMLTEATVVLGDGQPGETLAVNAAGTGLVSGYNTAR